MNPGHEVLAAANALVRIHPERVRAVVKHLPSAANPGAFWIRRVAGH